MFFRILLSLLILALLFVITNIGNVERIEVMSPLITVVLLSFDRPHNLDVSLPSLVSYNSINKILVYHGHPDHYYTKFKHSKVEHIRDAENNQKMFTLRRFLHASSPSIQTPYVLFLDDDVIPSSSLVNKMLQHVTEDSTACVGPVGRTCNNKGYYHVGKSTVLTPIMLVSKNTVQRVWKSMQKDRVMWNRVLKQKGNCEDLFFQIKYKHLYQKNPQQIMGPYRSLDKSNGFSTTNQWKHYTTRFKFCRRFST